MSFSTDLTRPVAKKKHQCDVCFARIEPGTRYARWGGVSEGDWFTCTVHEPCYSAMREAYTGYDDEMFRVSDINTDEALDVYHEAGVLAAALSYLREVMDFTDTEMEGKDDAAIIAIFDQRAAEQLATNLDRIARHFGRYGWDFNRLDEHLRAVVKKQGLWLDGALTEKGRALAATAGPLFSRAVPTLDSLRDEEKRGQ